MACSILLSMAPWLVPEALKGGEKSVISSNLEEKTKLMSINDNNVQLR